MWHPLRRWSPIPILVSALALLGCGDDGPGSTFQGIRFTGARAGSVPWSNQTSYWLEETNRSLTLLPASLVDEIGSVMIRVDLGHVGEPRAGSFRDGQDGASCFIVYEKLGGSPMWSTALPQGGNDCGFSFASVRLLSEEMGPRGRTRRYEIDGSFSGRLTPKAGASGEIEASGGF